MGYVQVGRGSLFEGSDGFAEDKLLGLQHMAEGCEQFVLERLVLPLEVEHGNGLADGGRVGWR